MRLYLFPLFLLLSARPGLSQQQFRIGFLGGISTSQVDGDTYAGYDKAGVWAGGFVTRQLSPSSKWSTSFEITYIQKGSRKLAHPDKGDFTMYKLNLNYAEVPLLLRYDFTAPDSAGGRRTKFQVELGLAAGVLVRSKEEDMFGIVQGGVPFQKLDIPLIAGLGYLLAPRLGFDVRTEYSALPVRKGAIGQYYQNWTLKFLKPGYYNNLILFSLRYQV